MGHSVIILDFSVDIFATRGVTLYLDDALSIEFGPLAEWTMEFAQHVRTLPSEYCFAGL